MKPNDLSIDKSLEECKKQKDLIEEKMNEENPFNSEFMKEGRKLL